MADNVLHLRGLVRNVQAQTKRETGETYGTRITVLSEPDGGTLDMLAFSNTLPVADALALKGTEIDATVEVRASAGTRGGAFLNVNLIELDAVLSPEPV